MTQIILKNDNGKQTEAVSKQEFDGKVNQTNPLFILKTSPYKISDQLGSMGSRTLAVIHDEFANIQDGWGNFDSSLVFGGDDVKHMLTIGTFDHYARISTKRDGDFWQENLVLKSDYDKLANRVSALEKQIGGVLTSLYTKLCGTFTSLEVA